MASQSIDHAITLVRRDRRQQLFDLVNTMRTEEPIYLSDWVEVLASMAEQFAEEEPWSDYVRHEE